MALWRWVLLATLAPLVSSFQSAALRNHVRSVRRHETADDALSGIAGGFTIFQKSITSGAGFKQSVADSLAGEYDKQKVSTELDTLIASAPLVVFIWQASPFSKKALAALELAGAEPKVVRLDDPFSTGNPLRAELGRRTGKTSVPSVWIGGTYVGGFDDGPSDDAPGLISLAFQSKLRPTLERAGCVLTPLTDAPAVAAVAAAPGPEPPVAVVTPEPEPAPEPVAAAADTTPTVVDAASSTRRRGARRATRTASSRSMTSGCECDG